MRIFKLIIPLFIIFFGFGIFAATTEIKDGMTTKAWQVGAGSSKLINCKNVINNRTSDVFVPVNTLSGEWNSFIGNTPANVSVSNDATLPAIPVLALAQINGINDRFSNINFVFTWPEDIYATNYKFSVDGLVWNDLGHIHGYNGLLVPGSYNIQIKGCRANGDCGCISNIIIAKSCEVLNTPLVLTSNGPIFWPDEHATFSWNVVTPAPTFCPVTKYQISSDDGATYADIPSALSQSYTYNDLSTLGGLSFKIKVRPCSVGGCSSVGSNMITASILNNVNTSFVPSLTASPNPVSSGVNVNFSWSAIPGALDYTALTGPSFSSPGVSLGVFPTTSFSALAGPSGSYDYKIQGCATASSGARCATSNGVHLVINGAQTAPDTLTGFVVSPTTVTVGGTVNFSWNTMPRATYYEYSFDGLSWAGMGNVTSVNNVLMNTVALNYPVYVRACNGLLAVNPCGGAASVSVRVNPPLPSSDPAVSLSATTISTTQTVTVTFANVANATYYEANCGVGWGGVTSGTAYGPFSPSTYTCNFRSCNIMGCTSGLSSRTFTVSCTPSCSGKACGADNGCGSPCQTGSCASGTSCVSGQCCYTSASCSYFSLSCGSYANICTTAGSVSCGTCTSPKTCNASGQCVCTPNCSGKACGADNGCGSPCQTGSCAADTLCVSGQCCYTSSSCSYYGLTCGTYTNVCSTAGPITCGPACCVPSTACAANTCTGSTCSNGCGGTVAGTKNCCVPSTACAANTCTGSTCSNGCGGTVAGTKNCCVPNYTSANCSSFPTYHGCTFINSCGNAVCCP